MITALEVENFKGFSRRQRVELAPLTLLFGANGAGKSAVLHALRYAAELLLAKVSPPNALVASDEGGLGGFPELVYQRDLARSISIALEVRRDRTRDPSLELPPEEPPAAHDGLVSDDHPPPFVGLDDRVESLAVGLSIRWDGGHRRPQVHRLTLGFNGAPPCLVVDANPASSDRVTLALDARPSVWPAEPPDASTSTGHPGLVAWLARAGVSRHADGLYRLEGVGVEALGVANQALRRGPELGLDLRALPAWVATLLRASLDTVRSRLRGLVHVRAPRPAPAWRPGGARENRGTEGRGAWAALAADPGLLDETNRALERVGSSHRLELVAFRTLPVDQPPPQDGPPDELAVGLRDLRTDVVMPPSQAGRSLAALIPVLVCLCRKPSCEPGLLLLEEPALHLAPAQQTLLGDELRRAAEHRQVLVETHSEPLLLRLQRRMRETDDTTLAPGVAPGYPEQVKVWHVGADEGGVRIEPLGLDRRGAFVDRKQGSLFGERAEELF